MMTLVWIDDLRDPKNFIDTQKYNVYWAKNYNEFNSYLESYDIPDIIWFDHDLGEEMTGYDCAKRLIECCQFWDCDLPEFHSQSSNPPGRENILNLLNSYKRFREHEKRDS